MDKKELVKCGDRDCKRKVTGGWETYVYANASDVAPTIIDKWITYWCVIHQEDLRKHIRLPGRTLTDEELL